MEGNLRFGFDFCFSAAFWFWEQEERIGGQRWLERRDQTRLELRRPHCLSTKKGSHERNTSIISIISDHGKKKAREKERQGNEPTGKLPLEHPDQDLGQVIDLQNPGISRSLIPRTTNLLPFLQWTAAPSAHPPARVAYTPPSGLLSPKRHCWARQAATIRCYYLCCFQTGWGCGVECGHGFTKTRWSE